MLQKKEKIPDQQPLCHCSCMDPVVRAETGDSSSIASEYNPTDILEYFVSQRKFYIPRTAPLLHQNNQNAIPEMFLKCSVLDLFDLAKTQGYQGQLL